MDILAMSSPIIESSDDREEEKKEPPVSEATMSKIEEEDAAPKKEEPHREAAAEEPIKKEKKHVDWPMKNIEEPHENDVLYGRGGGTNHHAGNKRYRKLVEDKKLEYVNCKRLDKPLVALSIIREWRGQDPPGRFLKIDEKTGLWSDVGDKKAREKTSQALREKAPLIRKQQEDEKLAGEHGEDDSDYEEGEDGNGKSTRFAEGTNMDADGLSRAILARDHSLGREYLNEGEAVTLDGFSWQDPFQSGGEKSDRSTSGRHPGAPVYVDSRSGSQGPAFRFPSHGSLGPPPPPPPPGAYAHMTSGDPRYASQGRYESWGSIPPPMPGYAYPQHSGSWTYRDPSAGRRENSLGQNPLPHASVGHPAAYPVFDSRTGSWGPPQGYGPPMYHHSAGGPPYPPMGSHMPPPPPPSHPPPPHVPTSPGRSHGFTGSPTRSSGPPSPPYLVDPAVASAWSGQDPMAIAKSWSMGSSEDLDRFRSSDGRSPRSPISEKHTAARPDIIKRATSNQNETFETKPGLRGPSVKRVALNRDNSMASNRLKEQYVPGLRKPFSLDREMRQLSANLRQTSLSGVKPKLMSDEDKQSTIDLIAMDLMVKPVSLSFEARTSTIEALALDLDDDSFLRPEPVQRGRTMEEVFRELREDVPKPSTLSSLDRLTTNDLMDLVNEPIGEDDELFAQTNRATGDIVSA